MTTPWAFLLAPLGFVVVLALLVVVAILAVPLVALLNRRRSSEDR